MLPDFRHEKA
jgi:hypothetical protein